jgi:uncharacterized DUF497 family protein
MQYSVVSTSGWLESTMFEAVLQQIQAKIRTLDYVMTIHADEEMDDDGLSILDVEQVILAGQIAERQRDRDSGEWKYLINGQTDDGLNVTVVTKLSPTDTVVIITVYVE